MSTIGEKIKKVRKEMNLSQQELGGEVFTKSYISQIERGIINPSVKSLEILAARLGKPVSFFWDNTSTEVSHNNELTALDIIFDAQRFYEENKLLESKKLLEDTLDIRHAIEHKHLINLLYLLANINFDLDNFKESLGFCEEVLEIIDESEKDYLFKTYFLLGNIWYELGDRRKSLNYYLDAKKIFDFSKIKAEINILFQLFRNIGILYAQIGNISISIEYLEQLIKMSKKHMIIDETILDAYRALSDLSSLKDDAIMALEYLGELLPLYQYFNDANRLSGVYSRYVKIYFENQDYDNSMLYITKMEDIIPQIKDNISRLSMTSYAYLYKGKLCFIKGNYKKAEELLLEALSFIDIDAPTTDLLITKTRILLSLGEFYTDLESYDKALSYSIMCEELVVSTDYNILLPDVYRLLGKIYIGKGKTQEGQKYYDKAISTLKEESIRKS